MPEVSQQMYVGSQEVFGFMDGKWSGINSYEQVIPPAAVSVVYLVVAGGGGGGGPDRGGGGGAGGLL